MDLPIENLKHTDEATKRTLENLRKKKRKFDIYKYLHFYTFYAVVIVTGGFIYYFYNQIASHSSSYLALISLFLQDERSISWFSFLFVLFCAMSIFKKEKEKLEKEYHEMRCEIVDKSKDLWKQEDHWKNRHHEFEVMKKEYDINLFNAKK